MRARNSKIANSARRRGDSDFGHGLRRMVIEEPFLWLSESAPRKGLAFAHIAQDSVDQILTEVRSEGWIVVDS